jgi:hypothetical protein
LVGNILLKIEIVHNSGEGGITKMAGSKYGKYIVTELKQNIAKSPWAPPTPVQPVGKGRGGRLLFLDSEVVPEAFYVETAWSFPRKADEPPRTVAQAHKHDYDEVLGMFGTNVDDPYDLCGEVEFWLDDEKHVLTKSCIIFIPKGLQHCPLIYRRVDRPIFNFTTGPGRMYF